ncbi:TPR repeat-containing protein [Variovorax paradoxus B4]|uniref:protein O-GlcNAc transferase n=1 Tax=Variovorax paradoxus B4 TaxID=1246301 RepID=T1XJN7_VARPD|nr:glycosyltransferase family 41 protein [Variovorax paradoxus]AGU53072.1 TPR repeat-containing protein [Variovorax paradoxus B4]
MEKPESDDVHAFDAALRLHQDGQLEKAEAAYEALLARRPEHYSSLAMLGILNLQRNRPEIALRYADFSIAREARVPNAHATRGDALHRLEKYEEAADAFQAALALNPNAYDVLTNYGITLVRLGRHDEALACYNLALEKQPSSPDTLYNRGVELLRRSHHAEALDDFDAVLLHSANDVDAQIRRIYTLCGLHRHQDAWTASENAVARGMVSPGIHQARGYVLMGMGEPAGAAEAFRQAIGMRAPSEAGDGGGLDHLHAGRALVCTGRYEEAFLHFRQAATSVPMPAYAAGDHLLAMLQTVQWDDFEHERAKVLAAVASGKPSATPFVMAVCSDDPQRVRQAGETFAKDMCANVVCLPMAQPERRERIRIGYFSADFHAHATAVLMAELIEQHDRTQFEVFLFSFGVRHRDDVAARLAKAADHFLDVVDISDAAICALARELGIDIAIDLKGYTQNCRLGIFAGRAAPVQVNYLGYPGSMGATFIDYIIGDAIVTPIDHAPFYTEKIVTLPGCYQPNSPGMRPIATTMGDRASERRAAGLPAEAFVFCCFNNTYKITPSVFELWMRILRSVSGSVLWLYEPDGHIAPRLRAHAAKQGVAAERLVFASRQPLPLHLARHALADLFLDTFPCNAHTTGSDALWAGLPMLTCLGDTFSSRVAASLLCAVGLPGMVANSLQQYEAMACSLAANPGVLERQREQLLKARTEAPLFDVDRYRRGIEDAYRRMWDSHRRGDAPAPIAWTRH